MTDTRKTLMKKLAMVQNHPANINQDIITFTGFMDEAEVAEHFARYLGYAIAEDLERILAA